jgi:endonuclease YncB( thermonuclease family)
MVLREGGGKAAGSPPASSLRGGQKLKVRLADIDAPEKDQPFGQQSRDSLLEMVGKKQVQIDSRAVDQYGRTVGLITLDGRNVNQEQVKRGMAWAYSYNHNDKTYLSLQSDARIFP